MNGELALAIPADGPTEDRLAQLFDVHEARLYRVARRLVGSREDARDLVQETFLRAAQSLQRIPIGFSREQAWLVRVLVNLQRDHWRKMAVRDRLGPVAVGALPSDPQNALATKQAVWMALNRLHPRRRAIIMMHELDGTAVPVIAALLGLSRVTVQWHLSMGRRDLKRLLQPFVGEIR